MNEKMLGSLNQRSLSLCEELDEDLLRIKTQQHPTGKTIDFAPDGIGTVQAGIQLTRICMSGLAEVELQPAYDELPLSTVVVKTDHPLLACIAAQYAGWPFSHEKYFSMCSGPARLNRGQEEILSAFDLAGNEPNVVGIFETRSLPGDAEHESFVTQCESASSATICVAPTASLPGLIQIVGRSVETTMHKLFELGFDLRQVRSVVGSAPLPPLGSDDMQALGWTNDAILYGADVRLWVACDDQSILKIGEQIPSNSSTDFGRPFIDIFKSYEYDFYKIDKHLFSPAKVTIHNSKTGNVFQFGKLHFDILKQSFDLNR